MTGQKLTRLIEQWHLTPGSKAELLKDMVICGTFFSEVVIGYSGCHIGMGEDKTSDTFSLCIMFKTSEPLLKSLFSRFTLEISCDYNIQ